jgi:curved DNA-binding protein
MQFKDYYASLGVPRDANAEQIKRAYRKQARKYHPDVSKEKNCEAQFKDVQEAYEVLKDDAKREAYDRLGQHWKDGDNFTPPPGNGAHAGFGSNADFSEFFAQMFDRGQARQHTRRDNFQMRGQDRSLRIQISLADSYLGASRAVSFESPAPDGRGRVTAKTINVSLPKGIVAGQHIRLAGQGTAGYGGGPAGDLFLEVEFEADRRFHAEGRDIYLELPILPWEAALGAKVVVPTLGGKVELSIPPGSQAGRKLRLGGRGLPGQPAGDQLVVLTIHVPTADDEAQRAAYRELARLLPNDPRADLLD